jgi:phosphoribosyl 1,2-cyclic phosphate phosphodiesterase
MPVLGFRFGSFTYITDANYIEEAEKNKIRGSNAMVLNALRHEKHLSHFTLSEAVATIQELNIPQAYLVHISHQLGLHATTNKQLPNGIELAFDGLQVNI